MLELEEVTVNKRRATIVRDKNLKTKNAKIDVMAT